MSSAKTRTRAFAWYDVRQARGRLLGAAAACATGACAVPSELGWSGRFVGAFDAGGLILLVLTWLLIARATPAETKRRAAADDPGRTVVWALVILSSGVSVFAATHALRHAKELDETLGALLVALSFLSVAVAWALTHSAYALRYAHLYYREHDSGGTHEAEGGLVFPGNDKPCTFDFAYFSFVIGMCFQVSDVAITSPTIRRGALGHSILSFAYNTAIVALTLNLVFGYIG